jgi:hypothetical protein
MNKGCIIAIAVVFALAAVAAILIGVKGVPWFQKIGSAGIVYGVEIAVDEYTEKYGGPPPGDDHVAIVKEITGGNADKRDFFPPDLTKAIIEGKVHDGYGNALVIERDANGTIKVSSSGKDGVPGNEDDITSEDMPAEMREEFRRDITAD